MASEQQLLTAAGDFFAACAENAPSRTLLTYFSTGYLVVIQHAPRNCPFAKGSRLTGMNAIRSYFDLIATNFSRSDMIEHSSRATPAEQRVDVAASVTWTWRKSRRSWREDFNCTLIFDEQLKIVSFVIQTLSGPRTCVMRAVDEDLHIIDRSLIEVPI